ncbi:hypothetical protein I7I53_04273 [Histoplasma capsulatum var. duboisii H88]|uniref:Uncharacterized protein n=1 Tax=Ajellomyces capsulatus (strain H88) TaxID=544711 RepID=A0A8A1LS39_AJEC8|nr:hypothetical protein I7I53_04273 [Histoplasma capsulatum var. duboisii H88]
MGGSILSSGRRRMGRARKRSSRSFGATFRGPLIIRIEGVSLLFFLLSFFLPLRERRIQLRCAPNTPGKPSCS